MPETKIAHNDANIAKLAQYVVDSMDLKDLMTAMQDHLECSYKNDPELFAEEWENYFE